MKYLLSICFILLALISCKKSEDVDPRDQYVGNYAVTSQEYGKNDIVSGMLIITKGDREKELTYSFPYYRVTSVMLDGQSFFFNQSDKAKDSAGDYWITYFGDGSFTSDNGIKMDVKTNVRNKVVTSAIRGKKL